MQRDHIIRNTIMKMRYRVRKSIVAVKMLIVMEKICEQLHIITAAQA